MASDNQNNVPSQQQDYSFLNSVALPVEPVKRRVPKPLFVLMIAVAILLIVGVVLALSVKQKDVTQPNLDIVSSIQPEVAGDAIDDMDKMFAAISANQASNTAKYIESTSVVYELGATTDVFNDLTGQVFDWSSCRNIDEETYESSEDITELGTYSVLYLKYACSSYEGTSHTLKLDVRKNTTDNSGWKLYYLVTESDEL